MMKNIILLFSLLISQSSIAGSTDKIRLPNITDVFFVAGILVVFLIAYLVVKIINK
jgi:hypothetical protein